MLNPNDTMKRLLSLDTESQRERPVLFDILLGVKPENAIEQLLAYPHEARYVSDNGTTALHLVLDRNIGDCFYKLQMEIKDRVELVKLLLDAAPALAWHRTKGRTPLSTIFEGGAVWEEDERTSFSIVELLVKAFEKRREDELFLIDGRVSLLALTLSFGLHCKKTIALLMNKPYCRGSEEMRARHPQGYLHLVLDKKSAYPYRHNEDPYEVVCMIINSHPESVQERRWSTDIENTFVAESLPIHLAMNISHPSLPLILEALIAAEPWTVHAKNGSGYTPIELIPYDQYSSWDELRPVMLPLLRVLYSGHAETFNGKRWRAVHALLSVECPANMAIEVMEQNPDQMLETNEDGNLPLHLAASSISFEEVHFDVIVDACFDNWDENLKRKFHEAPLTFKKQMEEEIGDVEMIPKDRLPVRYALDANPAGAKVLNERGDLALHIAAEHDVMWDEGIENLIAAEPRALTSRNLASGMFPFMLAAIGKLDNQKSNSVRKANIIRKHAMWEKARIIRGKKVNASKVDEYASHIIGAFVDLPNLTTIYQLIRTNPEPISCGIPTEDVNLQ